MNESPLARAGVTDLSVELLRQTRPWVKLLSVFLFLGSGFMLLAAAMMLVVGSIAPGGTKFPAAFGLVYVPFAALYVYPASPRCSRRQAASRREPREVSPEK